MTAISTTPGTRPTRLPSVRQLGVDTAYVVVGFPWSIITFVVLVTGLSLGVGLTVTLLGIPVMVATLYAARGFAWMERARIPAVLGEAQTPTRYRPSPDGAGVWRRLVTPISDPQAWLDLAFGYNPIPIRGGGVCRGLHLVDRRDRRCSVPGVQLGDPVRAGQPGPAGTARPGRW